MTSTASNVRPPAQPAPPVAREPGYINTLSLKGGEYKVYAYIEEANGTKTYLPSNFDAQAFEKVRSLSWGLLNAHDNKRLSLNEAPYEIKGLDARGLIKSDNTAVSHDFTIQPVSQLVADQMASSLALSGKPIQPAAIKALDVWNMLEEVIRNGMQGSNPSNPVHLNTPPSPLLQSTPASSTLPGNPPLPPSSLTPPVIPLQQTPLPATNPIPQSQASAPLTSIDRELANHNLEQPDWYERLPVRLKSRLVNDIVKGRCPLGGIYAKVWNHFDVKARELLQSNPASHVNALTLLEREQRRLSNQCRQQPSGIQRPIRQMAEQVYEAFLERQSDFQVREKINALMVREFDRKDELFQRIRQQAEAENVAIAGWDSQWAQNHYSEDPRRFVQALARWLDND